METLETYIKNREIDRKITDDFNKKIKDIIQSSNSNATDIIESAMSAVDSYNKGIELHNKEIRNSDTANDISEMDEISISLNNSNGIDEKDFEELFTLNVSVNDIAFEEIATDFFNHIVQQHHNNYLDSIALAKKTAAKFNLNEQEVIEHHRKDFFHNLSENELNIESISFAKDLFNSEFKRFIYSSEYEEEFKQIIGTKIIEHYINNGLKTPIYYADCKRKFNSVVSFIDLYEYKNKKNENTTCDYLLDFMVNSKKVQFFCITHYHDDQNAKKLNKIFPKIYDQVTSDLIRNPENIDSYFQETTSNAYIKTRNSASTEVVVFNHQSIENIMDFIISNNLYLDIKKPENAKCLDLISLSNDTSDKAKKNIKQALDKDILNSFNKKVEKFLIYCEKNEISKTLNQFETNNSENNYSSPEFKI